MVKAEPSDVLELRLENLKAYFLLSLYRNICRSLFEKDKLLFSFLLAIRLMEFRDQLDQEAFRFLLTGGLSLKDQLPEHPSLKLNTDTLWLSQKSWGEISRLSDLHSFKDLYRHFYDLNTLERFR